MTGLCGCDNHHYSYPFAYCYVLDPLGCLLSQESGQFEGAAWRNCSPPSPPSPLSPPPLFSPPPLTPRPSLPAPNHNDDVTPPTADYPPASPVVPPFHPLDYEIEVYSVGGRIGNALHPEPYKPTVVRILRRPGREPPGVEDCFVYAWHLRIHDDEHVGLRNTTKHEMTTCGPTATMEFKDAGTYELTVSDLNIQHTYVNITLRNIYVRREVRALTRSEWLDYVDAVWTIRNISTAVGGKRFVCPSGNQSDYKEYDFFILFHMFHSSTHACDQFHFSLMQEYAHEAWNTMFERALQCVHPATSLHYWNEMKDYADYGHSSLLSSAVWNSTMYGSAVDDENGAAYVSNGAFAYFPMRSNRTGLCEYLDPEHQTLCAHIMADETIWTGNETHTGFSLQSPRDIESYKYVSRRTGYLFGHESEITPHTFPKESRIDEAIMNTSLYAALDYISGDEVHGHAHYWVSGLWGGMAVQADVANAMSREEDVEKKIDLFRLFVWPLDIGRGDECIACTSLACTCTNNSFEQNCWSDARQRSKRSMWWNKQSYTNLTQRIEHYGCGMMRGGTFDRSATANADPTFYIHHAFTFWLLDRAKRNSTSIPPYYNLEEDSKDQCAGHRLNDATVFTHLVPYTINQSAGQRHTWRDILFMWSDERRTARWE